MIDYEQKIIDEVEKKVREGLKNDISRAILVDRLLRYTEEEEISMTEKFARTFFMEIPESVKITKEYPGTFEIKLPEPPKLETTLGETIFKRKSIREYDENEFLSLETLSALLTYSYGIREFLPAYNFAEFPFRTAPTTGALQGIELYLVINNVERVKNGLYHFNPTNRSLELIFEGTCKGKMRELCVGQEFVSQASVVFILTIVLSRGIWKYLARYYRYALIDVGCVTQNIYLVATALNLGACAIAGFDQDGVTKFIQLDAAEEVPALIISIGAPIKNL